MHLSKTASACLLVLTSLVGCSGPSSTTTTSDDGSETVEAAFTRGSYVFVNDETASFVDLASGTTSPIGTGGQIVFRSVSPSGSYAVYATADTDSAHLMMFDRATGVARRLHGGSADLHYSGAWSPEEDAFAFGFYRPAMANDRPAQGAGDILVASVETGEFERLGCNLSREVILWSNPDQLVVRATDEMYRVRRSDCGTIQDVDISRWHDITPAPVGSRMAYIFRELAFNRETREYEPDSALFVAGTVGAGGVKVVGDRYRPRNPAWSPDGTELAFDVLVSPDSETRAVAVYDVANARTVYLSPPMVTDPSRTRPVWDPSGSQVSYLSDGQLVVHRPAAQAGTPVSAGGYRASRLLGWLTSATLVVGDRNGNAWLYDLPTGGSEPLGPGAAIVF